MVRKVDDNEKLMCLLNTSGQNRNMWFLTEYSLYEVFMQSRKSIAKVLNQVDMFPKTGLGHKTKNF